ncbi:hypothetical protein [Kitasatospora sp. NPDC088548]
MARIDHQQQRLKENPAMRFVYLLGIFGPVLLGIFLLAQHLR